MASAAILQSLNLKVKSRPQIQNTIYQSAKPKLVKNTLIGLTNHQARQRLFKFEYGVGGQILDLNVKSEVKLFLLDLEYQTFCFIYIFIHLVQENHF